MSTLVVDYCEQSGVPRSECVGCRERPARALTIKQPWATLIAAGIKDVENRSWPTSYRGPLLIHAGKAFDHDWNACAHLSRRGYDLDALPAGGIIARCQLVDCVQDSDSPWAEPDQWHWILRDVEPVAFTACRGMLGLWTPHS